MATERRQWNRRVDDLLQAGKRAFEDGNPRLAHDIWREAATVDPYDERVWMALMRVLETQEDKRVCLENILAINPLNAKARRQLRVFQTTSERANVEKERHRAEAEIRRKQNRRTLRRALFMGVGAGVAGITLGIIASIIVYGYQAVALPVLF
jgi:ferric-dicitrate binding protein FerR (iron transport regulator)